MNVVTPHRVMTSAFTPQLSSMPTCLMFQCKQCHHQEFELITQPGVKAEITVTTNAHGDIEIHVNNQRFVADLAFMNRFGRCQNCQATKQWEYAEKSKS
jgi:hypothetical protein